MMELYGVAVLVTILAVSFSISQTLLYTTDQSCTGSNDWTTRVKKNIGVSSGILWEAKSFGLRQCARFCVSRAPCASFTYHEKTTVCALSRDTVDNGTVRKGPFLLYSEFRWLPADVSLGIVVT